ncbi:MAG: hypothetical protein Q8O14_14645 [bacterium]|nr:hypothetical protein [bacterium]
MYQKAIEEELARQGRIGTNPRWVEGWMRLECGTLAMGRVKRASIDMRWCISFGSAEERESVSVFNRH